MTDSAWKIAWNTAILRPMASPRTSPIVAALLTILYPAYDAWRCAEAYASDGTMFIDCTHADAKGAIWSTY